jgi:hypothetical protein
MSEEEQERHDVLNYAAPDELPLLAARVCATAISTCILVVTIVALSILGGGLALLIVPTLLLLLIVVAVKAGRIATGRSTSLGIWIGIGLAMLVEGACFGIARFG